MQHSYAGDRLISFSVGLSLATCCPLQHLLKKAEQWGVDVTVLAQLRFDIPATYKFHKRDSVDVEVDLLRLQKRSPHSDSDANLTGKG